MDGLEFDIRTICRDVVRELQNRKGYRFLTAEEFEATLLQRVSQGDCDFFPSPHAVILKIAKTIYAEALYRGCTSSDRDCQELAFRELGDYLYRVACHDFLRYGSDPAEVEDQAAEAVQEVLLNIFRSLSQVKSPAAFLGYSVHALNRHCSRKSQQINRRKHYEDPVLDDEGNEERYGSPFPFPSLTGYLLDCLKEALKRLNHPDWVQVLICEYFGEQDANQIALQVQKTVNHIYQIRKRAKDALRQDSQLRDCLGMEEGELPEFV